MITVFTTVDDYNSFNYRIHPNSHPAVSGDENNPSAVSSCKLRIDHGQNKIAYDTPNRTDDSTCMVLAKNRDDYTASIPPTYGSVTVSSIVPLRNNEIVDPTILHSNVSPACHAVAFSEINSVNTPLRRREIFDVIGDCFSALHK